MVALSDDAGSDLLTGLADTEFDGTRLAASISRPEADVGVTLARVGQDALRGSQPARRAGLYDHRPWRRRAEPGTCPDASRYDGGSDRPGWNGLDLGMTGDRRPATGDRRPATGDRRPATGAHL